MNVIQGMEERIVRMASQGKRKRPPMKSKKRKRRKKSAGAPQYRTIGERMVED